MLLGHARHIFRRKQACPMKFFAEDERSGFHRGEADLTGVANMKFIT